MRRVVCLRVCQFCCVRLRGVGDQGGCVQCVVVVVKARVCVIVLWLCVCWWRAGGEGVHCVQGAWCVSMR